MKKFIKIISTALSIVLIATIITALPAQAVAVDTEKVYHFTDIEKCGPTNKNDSKAAFDKNSLKSLISQLKALKSFEVSNTDAMKCLDWYISTATYILYSKESTDQVINLACQLLTTVVMSFDEYNVTVDKLSAKLDSVNQMIATHPQEYTVLTNDQRTAISNATKILSGTTTSPDYCNAYVLLDNAFCYTSVHNRVNLCFQLDTIALNEPLLNRCMSEPQLQKLNSVKEYISSMIKANSITNKDCSIATYKLFDSLSFLIQVNFTKTHLLFIIENAKTINNTNLIYTEDSYNNLQLAILYATNVQTDILATNDQIYKSCIQLIMATIMLEPSEKYGLFGDVDGNFKVTLKDATSVQHFLSESTNLTVLRQVLADVDGDNKITLKDCFLIQEHVAEKINHFPVNAL